ncbi:MAG: C39 family peptidase [Chitinispirillaceae bacterium]|nr:C39 family peptidase [Chitinispirillaceae bacterium]
MKRMALFTAVFLLNSFTYGQVLQVSEVIQEQSEWCWAATSACLLTYYGKTVTQCTIADYARTNATWHDFGTESCCGKPGGKCNYWNYNFGFPGSIQDILKQWNIESKGSGGSLTIEKVKQELGEGRPFIIRFALVPSGGHFVVGHGIVDSTMYYMNPWPGEGFKIGSYSWVKSNSKHSWQGTNVILTNPVHEAVELVSPPDSSVNQSRAFLFTWRSLPAASYRFQCSKTQSFDPLQIDTVITNDTSVHLDGFFPSTTYFWRVCKVDTADFSGICSPEWHFTTETRTSVAGTRKTSPGFMARSGKGKLLLSYTVADPSVVTISLHSLQGRLFRTILSGFHQKGQYETQCRSTGLPPGNYILSVCAGRSRKTVLLPITN